MKKRLVILSVLLLTALLLGVLITNRSSSEPNKQLKIAASFYPMYFFASEIAGNRAEVFNITPAGVEPHDFEPTTQDLAKISNSHMVVLNGGVELWADKLSQNLDNQKTVVIRASEGFLTRQTPEDGKLSLDPHVWLSPNLAKQEIDRIAGALQKLDPGDESYYLDNAKQLKLKLDKLDQSYKTGLGHCKQKDIVTSHAAFGYLANAYGLNQVAIAGLSPDEEPSSSDLIRIAQYVREHNIKYIFFESLVSPKLADTLATEVGAKTLVLDPIEALSQDDLAAGKNYLTKMQDNLANLKVALECD